MRDSFKYVFKYIIVGDPSVGKSCILNQFLNGDFTEEYDITVGVEFGAKTVNVKGQKAKLQIWDTAGQDSFKSITRAYYRGSAAALICYDITCRDSFDNIENWIKECQTNGNQEMTLILVGNKIDLNDEREVSIKEGREFAQQNGMLFFETSAKTAQRVEEIFKESANQIFIKIEKGVIDPKNECFGVKKGNNKTPLKKIPKKSINRIKDDEVACC